jgi:hypothetical protein
VSRSITVLYISGVDVDEYEGRNAHVLPNRFVVVTKRKKRTCFDFRAMIDEYKGIVEQKIGLNYFAGVLFYLNMRVVDGRLVVSRLTVMRKEKRDLFIFVTTYVGMRWSRKRRKKSPKLHADNKS